MNKLQCTGGVAALHHYLFPERFVGNLDIIQPWIQNGTRIIVWCLAALQTAPPTFKTEIPVHRSELTRGIALLLPNSRYFHNHHGMLTSEDFILRSPLTQDFYDDTISIDFRQFKEDVIVFDDDYMINRVPYILNPNYYNHCHDCYNNGVVKNTTELRACECVILGGLNHAQLVNLYSKAKVVVDFFVPGFERIVQEAVCLVQFLF